MSEFLKNIISKFEDRVGKLNSGRHAGPYSALKVTVLGQQALLLRQEYLKNFSLIATNDFDGLLNGEIPLEDIFKAILREEGLTYDEDSEYIWLPAETEYELIYKSEYIEIVSPYPIYLIVSKALKASEKNKALVIQAMQEFTDDLLQLFEKYNVDVEYFLDKE